ncbi:MAG: nucleotidyl transferase AbiEii/AbiGii toxin family protein [Deltaproteobacteria bacterium]|nr:nucleotidyl transferase AbiEii/AbiGii toxin family protein [Deltaproteobacteria bacterium]
MTSWRMLEEVVASRVLQDARRVSQALTRLAIPHALVGGLAVGLHGHPRATKDVDFLVGAEAFETTEPMLSFRAELADVVRWGVIDLIAALPEDPPLVAELTPHEPGTVPVVSIEVLMLMKLRASRMQDLADVEALVRAGADVPAILRYLRATEPEHIPAFSRIAQSALAAP